MVSPQRERTLCRCDSSLSELLTTRIVVIELVGTDGVVFGSVVSIFRVFIVGRLGAVIGYDVVSFVVRGLGTVQRGGTVVICYRFVFGRLVVVGGRSVEGLCHRVVVEVRRRRTIDNGESVVIFTGLVIFGVAIVNRRAVYGSFRFVFATVIRRGAIIGSQIVVSTRRAACKPQKTGDASQRPRGDVSNGFCQFADGVRFHTSLHLRLKALSIRL